MTALRVTGDEPEPPTQLTLQLAYTVKSKTQLIPAAEEAEQDEFTRYPSLCRGVRSEQEAWPRRECFAQLLASNFFVPSFILICHYLHLSITGKGHSRGRGGRLQCQCNEKIMSVTAW